MSCMLNQDSLKCKYIAQKNTNILILEYPKQTNSSCSLSLSKILLIFNIITVFSGLTSGIVVMVKQPGNMVRTLDRLIGYWEGGCGFFYICLQKRRTHTSKAAEPELRESPSLESRDRKCSVLTRGAAGEADDAEVLRLRRLSANQRVSV